jgi:hypothetical protein
MTPRDAFRLGVLAAVRDAAEPPTSTEVAEALGVYAYRVQTALRELAAGGLVESRRGWREYRVLKARAVDEYLTFGRAVPVWAARGDPS